MKILSLPLCADLLHYNNAIQERYLVILFCVNAGMQSTIREMQGLTLENFLPLISPQNIDGIKLD